MNLSFSEFYEPEFFRTQHKTDRQASNVDGINPDLKNNYITQIPTPSSMIMRKHHNNCLLLYNDLIDNGVCREQARGVLPQNLYTSYYGSCNLNNLMKFIDLRADSHAQWEIQKVAEACLEIATEAFPITVNAYREIRASK
jgi:thymidylate synthase (FAD)